VRAMISLGSELEVAKLTRAELTTEIAQRCFL
jgi:hypothetical protein